MGAASDRVLLVSREEDSLWVSEEVVCLAEDLGFEGIALWELGIAASELATNVARHGGGGRLTVRLIDEPKRGLELVAEDNGPGFADIDTALRDGVSEGRVLADEVPLAARHGLGTGLGALQRLTDELAVENKPGGGARVRAAKWLPERPARCLPDDASPALVLGIGNTLLSDDGVGVYAARAAAALLRDTDVEVREAELGGFALLDLLEGFDRAVVVDAVAFEQCRPGEVMIIREESLPPSLHLTAGHQVDLPTVLELGRRLGRPMPETVTVVGVQAADITTFGERCTPAVEAAIPVAARIVAGLLRVR